MFLPFKTWYFIDHIFILGFPPGVAIVLAVINILLGIWTISSLHPRKERTSTFSFSTLQTVITDHSALIFGIVCVAGILGMAHFASLCYLCVCLSLSSPQHNLIQTLTAVYNVLQMRTVTPQCSTQHTLLVWSCSSLVSNSLIVRLPSNVHSLWYCFNCSVTPDVLFREEQGLHRNRTTRV